MVKRVRLPAPDPPDPRRPLVVRVSLPDRAMCGNGDAIKHELTALRRVAREEGRLAGRTGLIELYAALPADGDRRRSTADAIECARTAVEVGGLWQVGRVPVKVDMRWHPVWADRPLDDDNTWRGLKSILDGIAEAGAVANDRQFYMDGVIHWVKVDDLGDAGVMLRIGPPKEGATNDERNRPMGREREEARGEGDHENGDYRTARDRTAGMAARKTAAAGSVVSRSGSGARRDTEPDPLHPATAGGARRAAGDEPLTPAEARALVLLLSRSIQKLESASAYLVEAEATERDARARFREVCPVCHRILPAGARVLGDAGHTRSCHAPAAGRAYTKLMLLAQSEVPR